MKSKKALLGVVALLFLGMNSFAQDYKPGELIVRFKEGPIVSGGAVKTLYRSLGVKEIVAYSKTMGRLQTVKLQPGMDTFSALRSLQRNPMVESAQLNYILRIPEKSAAFVKSAKKHPYGKQLNLFAFFQTEEESVIQGPKDRPKLERKPKLPNEEIPDERASELWGIKKIQARTAWDLLPNNLTKITVGVIDTGIDYNHEDLGYNLWRKKDQSGQEFVGYDFIHNDTLPYDDQGHGSHTAGTIGAVPYNGIGVIGVTPAVNIMSLKFLGGEGSGSTSEAIRAIDYAIDHGARVLSNSWGGSGDPDNDALRDAIIRAERADILFVVAAGNEETNNDTSETRSYPASFKLPNIISVLATNSSDEKAYFSNYGPKTTHIAAPGVNILSTVPGSQYKAASGTSMACPHVAGAAALIWSMKPNWSYKQVRDLILSSVDPIDGMDQYVSTGGRLNVANAIQLATKRLKNNR